MRRDQLALALEQAQRRGHDSSPCPLHGLNAHPPLDELAPDGDRPFIKLPRSQQYEPADRLLPVVVEPRLDSERRGCVAASDRPGIQRHEDHWVQSRRDEDRLVPEQRLLVGADRRLQPHLVGRHGPLDAEGSVLAIDGPGDLVGEGDGLGFHARMLARLPPGIQGIPRINLPSPFDARSSSGGYSGGRPGPGTAAGASSGSGSGRPARCH